MQDSSVVITSTKADAVAVLLPLTVVVGVGGGVPVEEPVGDPVALP